MRTGAVFPMIVRDPGPGGFRINTGQMVIRAGLFLHFSYGRHDIRLLNTGDAQEPSAVKRALSVLSIAAALFLSGCSFDAPKDIPAIDLRSLERSIAPNDALACPPGLCRADADFQSPIFRVSRQALLDRAAALVATWPRTELVRTDRVRTDSGFDQIVFVQRSRLFAFPDTIWIQSTGSDRRASLILYSRSRYGYWDFGVNRARIRDLLEELNQAAGP